ncbi:hypothetical protein JG687_00016130 [Phytophthora cactorum]|uniref:Uncharacterized protein n=1 Tax=Phytophthora cactorum TaxID=29920 RepID=A0A8T1TT15_9STRA|nr:hypothetical protein GQ600_9021 [Phytophthora cactorum]KAG6947374.1 hypothetical protein JG687_00016130 [Phytophthora cactorum]
MDGGRSNHEQERCPRPQKPTVQGVQSATREAAATGDNATHGGSYSIFVGPSFQWHCASRNAPLLSSGEKQRLLTHFGDEADAVAKEWTWAWWMMCMICITRLWLQRNRTVHHGEVKTTEDAIRGLQDETLSLVRWVDNYQRYSG